MFIQKPLSSSELMPVRIKYIIYSTKQILKIQIQIEKL